jgi:hypothetical protein
MCYLRTGPTLLNLLSNTPTNVTMDWVKALKPPTLRQLLFVHKMGLALNFTFVPKSLDWTCLAKWCTDPLLFSMWGDVVRLYIHWVLQDTKQHSFLIHGSSVYTICVLFLFSFFRDCATGLAYLAFTDISDRSSEGVHSRLSARNYI